MKEKSDPVKYEMKKPGGSKRRSKIQFLLDNDILKNCAINWGI